MKLDLELSNAVAAATRPRPRNRNCFLNAINAMCSGAFDELPWYVEGWANRWVWHGWLETRDGQVVDVTPAWRRERGTVYAPRYRYTIHDVAAHSSRRPRPTFPIMEDWKARLQEKRLHSELATALVKLAEQLEREAQ